ncbi:MAG TPA: pitrilysin family protein [Thermoplasmata archaeon]|nr:pitrilysin family protein [Thermoplasmata archaeon]
MSERNDPLKVEYADGPSGLRVVRQAPPTGAASFSATFLSPAGWAHDPPGLEATARLSSQLVTSGAGRRGRLELARYLDRAGATLTSHVDPESAEITLWGPATDWKSLLTVLADAVLSPRFEESDLRRVRRQLQERQLRELTQPASRAEREVTHAIFPEGHPYRETGLGDARSLRRIRAEHIRRFHSGLFAGPGSVLVYTGPASLSSVVRATHRLFADLPSASPPLVVLPRLGRPKRAEVRVDLPGRAQVEIRLAGASIARTDPQYAGAYLANEVLGGATMLSRLFHRVRALGGLAYHASSQLEAMRWGGHWSAQAGTGADRWPKVVPMLREEVERISSANVPARELDVVRESRIGEMQLSLESTSEAHELAVEVGYFGLAADHWKEWPSRLRSLTPREVRSAAETALDPGRAVTVLAGPLGAA